MREINRIICHCTATPEGRVQTVEDIRRMHVKDNHWSHIGYHYLIYLDGTIHLGRPIEEEGAHCKEGGHNRHSIGVCYIGGVRKEDGRTPEDTRTPEQKEAMKVLLQLLKAASPEAKIYGHRDFAKKDCPSFDATKEYEYISNMDFKKDVL